MRYLMLCLLFSFSLAGQQRLDLQTQYVWAESGLTMRAEGKAGGEKMLVIPFGAAVKVTGNRGDYLQVKALDGVSYTYGEERLKGEPYYMHGAYLEVIYEGKTGFVFDGYLAYYSPLVAGAPTKDLYAWLAANGGHPDTIMYGTYDEPLFRGRTVIHYSNGVTYSASEYEGGGSSTFTFPVGSIADGFLIAQRFFNVDDPVKNRAAYEEEGYMVPELLEVQDNGALHFISEMSETTITILGDILVISSSGGC